MSSQFTRIGSSVNPVKPPPKKRDFIVDTSVETPRSRTGLRSALSDPYISQINKTANNPIKTFLNQMTQKTVKKKAKKIDVKKVPLKQVPLKKLTNKKDPVTTKPKVNQNKKVVKIKQEPDIQEATSLISQLINNHNQEIQTTIDLENQLIIENSIRSSSPQYEDEINLNPPVFSDIKRYDIHLYDDKTTLPDLSHSVHLNLDVKQEPTKLSPLHLSTPQISSPVFKRRLIFEEDDEAYELKVEDDGRNIYIGTQNYHDAQDEEYSEDLREDSLILIKTSTPPRNSEIKNTVIISTNAVKQEVVKKVAKKKLSRSILDEIRNDRLVRLSYHNELFEIKENPESAHFFQLQFWEMLDGLASDLVKQAIVKVSGEVDDLAAEFVEQLFLNEFI